MSHKRKGQLTTSGEWAKHLRPLLRRAFWKRERQAGSDLVRAEGTDARAERQSSGSVEALVALAESLPPSSKTAEIWVPECLTMNGAEVSQDLAVSVLLDKLLDQAFFPRGSTQGIGGRLYRYRKE